MCSSRWSTQTIQKTTENAWKKIFQPRPCCSSIGRVTLQWFSGLSPTGAAHANNVCTRGIVRHFGEKCQAPKGVHYIIVGVSVSALHSSIQGGDQRSEM